MSRNTRKSNWREREGERDPQITTQTPPPNPDKTTTKLRRMNDDHLVSDKKTLG